MRQGSRPRCTRYIQIGIVGLLVHPFLYYSGRLPSFYKTRETVLDTLLPVQHLPVQQNDSSYNRTLSLIVLLQGELCNNLWVLATARRIQRYVQTNLPGIRLELIGQHQAARKWVHGSRDIGSCFPNFKNFSFEGGTWDPLFEPFQQKQKEWLGGNETVLKDVWTEPQIVYLQSLLEQQSRGDPNVPPPEPPGSVYSIPFLSASFDGRDLNYVLQHEDIIKDLRSFLKFDTDACCKLRADPDEAVFHFRNFVTEIKKASIRNNHNFIELSPNETVSVLFGNDNSNNNSSAAAHNNHNRKIAILSRFPNMAHAYEKAFRSHGWNARLIEGQSGVEDFCFAMSSKSMLVGSASSTYVAWAGILGNASLVRRYSVDISKTPKPTQFIEYENDQGRKFLREVYGCHEELTEELLRKSL